MKPSHYLDLTVINPGDMLVTGSSVRVPVMTRLFTTLHAVKRSRELDFALAFPGMREGEAAHLGDSIRVWSGDESTLESLHEHLGIPAGIAPHVSVGNVIAFMPASDERIARRAYIRYRIPSRKSRVEGSRDRRLSRSDHLPFFRVASRSTRHAFSISVLPMDVPVDATSSSSDSYGLSRLAEPLGLPVIESCA